MLCPRNFDASHVLSTADHKTTLLSDSVDAHTFTVSAMKLHPKAETVQSVGCMLLNNLATNGTRSGTGNRSHRHHC